VKLIEKSEVIARIGTMLLNYVIDLCEWPMWVIYVSDLCDGWSGCKTAKFFTTFCLNFVKNAVLDNWSYSTDDDMSIFDYFTVIILRWSGETVSPGNVMCVFRLLTI
jgi:hypothetical protein